MSDEDLPPDGGSDRRTSAHEGPGNARGSRARAADDDASHVPPRLAAAIQADLQPVRRLRAPGRRALWLAPLAAATLVAASRMFSLRGDARVLGWMLTWGASLGEMLLALAMITLALRNAIPGRALHARATMLASGAVLGFMSVVTLRTWDVSPTTLGLASPLIVGEICFVGTIVTAVPLLTGAAILAGRAFSVRPWSSGWLYGLGAGLGADAGWRLFCHYSDPAHVFPTHAGAVVFVAVLGMGMSGLIVRLTPEATALKRRAASGLKRDSG